MSALYEGYMDDKLCAGKAVLQTVYTRQKTKLHK